MQTDEPSDVVEVVPLRWCQRVCKPPTPNDYIVYLQEQEFELHDDDDDDSTTFNEVTSCSHLVMMSGISQSWQLVAS